MLYTSLNIFAGGMYDVTVYGICQFFGRYFGNLNKNDLYLVFQLPNGDGKIQFLIENTIGGIYTKI